MEYHRRIVGSTLMLFMLSFAFGQIIFKETAVKVEAILTTFTDVSEEAGLAVTGVGDVAWGDYDNDGYLDIYTTHTHDALYHNNGDGSFTNVTIQAGINHKHGEGAVWGDYDNDGYLDIFIVRSGRDILYHNNGDGTFTNVTAQAGISHEWDSIGAAWGDYDNDGYIDLYIVTYSPTQFPPGDPDILYHNNGDGTFMDFTSQAGIVGRRCGRAVTWGDYDNDGYLDIFVSNYRQEKDFLWHNNGDGTFTDVAEEAGVAGNYNTIHAAWGDYDNDGYLDLYISTVHHQNILYRNNGPPDWDFREVTMEAKVPGATDAYSAAWADYDNDGYIDLYTTSVYTTEPNHLYHNEGDGIFTEATTQAGVGGIRCGKATWADYDNDGYIDLLVPASDGLHLYHNFGNPNHWMVLRLIGMDSNRVAIGARVEVMTGYLRQIREVSGGSGAGQDSLDLEVGLGSYIKVDAVVVRWPSGRVDLLLNLTSDQMVSITEGQEPLRADIGFLLSRIRYLESEASHLRSNVRELTFEVDRLTSNLEDLMSEFRLYFLILSIAFIATAAALCYKVYRLDKELKRLRA